MNRSLVRIINCFIYLIDGALFYDQFSYIIINMSEQVLNISCETKKKTEKKTEEKKTINQQPILIR